MLEELKKIAVNEANNDNNYQSVNNCTLKHQNSTNYDEDKPLNTEIFEFDNVNLQNQ